MSTNPNTYFNRSLGAAVPDGFYDAVVTAAVRQGLTLADYVRSAVSSRMTQDGIGHPRIPDLKRTTYVHARGRR